MGWEVIEIKIDLHCNSIQWSYDDNQHFPTARDIKTLKKFLIIGTLECSKLILMVDLATDKFITAKRPGFYYKEICN